MINLLQNSTGSCCFSSDRYYQKLNLKRYQSCQPYVLIKGEKVKLKNGAIEIALEEFALSA